MSWLDSALDEMGLGPRWVRREAAPERPAASAADAAPERAGVAPASGVARLAQGAEPRARVMPDTDAPRPAPSAGDREAGVVSGLPDAFPTPATPAAAEASAAASARGGSAEAAPATAAASRGAPAEAPANAAAPRERATRPATPPDTTNAPAGHELPPDYDAPFDDPSWFDLVPVSDAEHGFEPAAPAVARSPVADLGWDELEARVTECQRCRLCEKRTRTVFGVGDREADWMLIGEAPGENEDRQGEPFVGQAGKLLDSMLHALSLKRDENVYIANVIKCRPPGNRNPEPDEVARCEPYLQRQVELVKPKLIVAMGRFAAQTLLKSTGSIASMRGRIHQYEGVPVVVSYHPAYLLRSLPDKSKAWADLCLARDTFRGVQHAQSDA